MPAKVRNDYTCPKCGEKQPSAIRLGSHLYWKHNVPGKSTSSLAYKGRVGKRGVAARSERISCRWCPITFKTARGRLYHETKYHPQERRYPNGKTAEPKMPASGALFNGHANGAGHKASVAEAILALNIRRDAMNEAYGEILNLLEKMS